MSETPTPPSEIGRFIRKHRVALAVGGFLLILMAANGDEELVAPVAGGQPMAGDGGGGGWTPTTAGDAGGGVDMEEWRRKNDAEDAQQRERVDSVREVQRCTDSATGETREVSIHVGC